MSFVRGMPQPNKPVSVQCTVRELVTAYNKGTIIDYQHNRGTQIGQKLRINTTPLRSMMTHGFEPSAFGSITLAKLSEACYQIADGHSRLNAVIAYLDQIDVTSRKRTLDYVVNVLIIHKDKHLKAYQINGTQKSQTGRQKILNPDTRAGNAIMRFLQHARIKAIPEGWWQPFFHILYTAIRFHASGETKKISMLEIKAAAPHAEKEKDKLTSEGKLLLADEVKNSLGEALRWHLGLVQEIQNHSFQNVESFQVEAVMKSSGMMQFMVLDYIGDKTVTNQKYRSILSKLDSTRNLALVKQGVSLISRRNEASRGTSEVEQILSPRVKLTSAQLKSTIIYSESDPESELEVFEQETEDLF